MNQLKNSWLTVNRQCNLRCRWCYAGSTEFKRTSDMPVPLAKKLIDLIAQTGIKNVALTGGEPTCYEGLGELIHYVSSSGLNAVLITNGVALSDRDSWESLRSQGLTSVNLSLKGCSEEDYRKNTGIEAYGQTLQAISNMAASNINHVVSMVLSSDNIDTYLHAVKDAVDWGGKEFHFSFEHDFSVLDGNENPYDIRKVFQLIDGFQNSYENLLEITKGHFQLHQSLPICIWDKKLIKKLSENNQIITSCQLLERSGLVFDTDGSLIPCNLMHQVPIGKYGEDFQDIESFMAFWNAPETKEMYQGICNYPGKECLHCAEKHHCGGGCVSNWYHYSYAELMDAFQAERRT
ncbi:MAG: radical SAM protein [Lachnospiraceae bacterium]|nr:radical SAM protein [Lachnospiraceae bacterium]